MNDKQTQAMILFYWKNPKSNPETERAVLEYVLKHPEIEVDDPELFEGIYYVKDDENNLEVIKLGTKTIKTL